MDYTARAFSMGDMEATIEAPERASAQLPEEGAALSIAPKRRMAPPMCQMSTVRGRQRPRLGMVCNQLEFRDRHVDWALNQRALPGRRRYAKIPVA